MGLVVDEPPDPEPGHPDEEPETGPPTGAMIATCGFQLAMQSRYGLGRQTNTGMSRVVQA